MKANLESVSLASLAREFYVSEGYLSRYFHRNRLHLQPFADGNENEESG